MTALRKKELFMRNKKTHSVTIKKKLSKCKLIFYAYNDLQYKYGCQLDVDSDIAEIKCNIPIDECELGDSYTTNFYWKNERQYFCSRMCL